MRPPRPRISSAIATRRAFGVASGERLRGARRSPPRRDRSDGAIGRESRRSRAADAGEAVHDHRRAPVPAVDEAEELVHVLLGGADEAFRRLADVVDMDEEVVAPLYAGRPRDRRAVIDERHDVARAGARDRLGELRKRADVDGGHAGSGERCGGQDFEAGEIAGFGLFAGHGSRKLPIASSPIRPGRPK